MHEALSAAQLFSNLHHLTFFGCRADCRACSAIEQSLTPDAAGGLPVWEQDIRWSLLGFALERGGGAGKEEAGDGRGLQLPSYLDWMEVELQVDSLPPVLLSRWIFLLFPLQNVSLLEHL